MITNPNHLAAALMELAEYNSPSMCSWVSKRLRGIADNLSEPDDDEDTWQYPKANFPGIPESSTETAGDANEPDA